MNTSYRSQLTGPTVLAIAALLGACDPPLAPQAQRSTPLTTTNRGPERLVLQSLPRVPTAASEVVLRGAWGSGPTQFGRLTEASRPGPMALDVDRQGRIHVLDQVNRRVKRYSAAGRLQAVVPLAVDAAATAEYLRVDGQGSLHLLAVEPGQPQRWLYHRHSGGTWHTRQLPASLGLPTGIFPARAKEVWVEQRHRWQTRLRDGARSLGRPDRSRPAARLLASRAGRHLARVSRVHQGRYTSTLFEVQTTLPLLAIQELAVGLDGAVYLALLMGRESGPPARDMEQVERVMVVRHPAGAHRVVRLEHGRATDCNDDLAVSAAGDIYQLFTTKAELRVRRWGVSR